MKGAAGLPWKGRAYLHKKYPLAFPLSESQLEVLDGLARNRPTNPNKLRKKIRKAYSFVYNTLKELELRRMVTVRREKNEKGTYSKIYDLALEGVLLVLHREMKHAETEESNGKFIQKTIDNCGHLLPLVLGKWHHFRKMGVEKTACFRLKVLVDSFAADPLGFRKGTSFIFGKLASEVEENICWYFYFQFQHFKYGPSWMNALRQDKEIKNYVIKELQLFRENMSKLDGIINSTLEEL